MSDASRRLLPPMAALHSFAAAARLGSFSRAGDELGLTQSAVSRQIAHLEDWLQLRLFDRTGRRVVLTAEGSAYAEAIAPALDRIRRATARAIERRPDRELSIATLPSFGMRWLAPRLPRLTAQIPDLTINFSARATEFHFADEAFDAAIHFGRPDWPDAAHDLLFGEQAVAVMSPDFIARHAIVTPADLARVPLLALSSRRRAWPAWFGAGSIAAPAPEPTAAFEHFLMLAQAAAAGAGAALIPSFLIEPELASGVLVSPFELTAPDLGAYYLVYPPDRLDSPAFGQFRDWLIAEVS
ncbi:LysR substrate-binding domain-containing protein [Sphingoaurantiacus capsulatus]|uniref:LysR substrate-binding domain-containing protein n=1 Tax=Sphingoaurantiacus capsulatus TaxID=1771310 RepID=A0ABV7XCJ1_9SPHN